MFFKGRKGRPFAYLYATLPVGIVSHRPDLPFF